MAKLQTLQIMRGIAASMVVVAHAIVRHAEWREYPEGALLAAQYSGTLGVAVFFVISGYIMIHTAGGTFGHKGAAATFLRRRIVRIVPLYWIATFLEIVLRMRVGGSIDLHTLLASLFFIPLAVLPGDYMRPVLGVGWTLNYEMFFYCIFAAMLFFSRRVGLFILFGTLVGSVAAGAAFKPLSDTSQPLTLFAFWTDPIILLFAGGVAIGLFPQWLKRAATVTHPIAIVAVLLSAYVLGFVTLVGSYPIPLPWAVGTWAICIFSVVICVYAKSEDDRGNSPAVLLGDVSYALYLFHFFSIVAVEKIWWFLFGHNGSILFVPAAYGASVAAAYVVHQVIEMNIARVAARGRSPSSSTQSEASAIRLSVHFNGRK